MSDSGFKHAAFAVVVTIGAVWMQFSYPLFGWIIHRLEGYNIANRTKGLVAFGMTLSIQVVSLLGLLILFQ